MDYKEIIKILNSIEDNVDINTLTYKSVKVWPMIRLEIWKILHSGFKYVSEVSKKNKWPLANFFEKFKAYFSFLIYKLKPNKYKPTDAVFLIARLERTVQVEGKFFSRFSNSLKEILEKAGWTGITLDLSSKKKPVWGETYFIDREKLFKLKKKEKIQNWEKLVLYIKNNFPDIKLNEKLIVNHAEATLEYEHIFEKILTKIKPKICFLECYYHPTGWGYIRACRKLGIKSIELQHGEQHGLYRNWNNIPKKGYDIMPHLWWCWGEESAQEINKWSQAVAPEHYAFVGGNPWIARFLANASNKKDADKEMKKNVLVAMPNKDLSAIANILEAFNSSPTNIKWYFRLHPMQLTGGYKEKLDQELHKSGHSNFEIEKACVIPLFDLLLNMDFLLTPWSTVAYEALALGAHPIITLGNDRAIFENYVNKGHFSFADTSEAILEIIKKDKCQFNFKEEKPYIETDINKMKKILQDLLQ